MGKPKGKNPKLKKLAKKKGLAPPESPVYSASQLLEQASKALEEYEVELAQKFVQRALETEPDHPEALKMAANMLLEAGDLESAKQCLGRAITVEPDSGHEKFFSMAQLMAGQEALALYKQGIDVLLKKMHADVPVEQEAAAGSAASSVSKEPPRELSNAYCAIAELFMTDLCDEPSAEDDCNAAIRNAIAADRENPEALRTEARLLKIKENFDGAREVMKKSLGLWLPRYQAFLDNKNEIPNFDPVDVCPLLYTTRIKTAQLLLELEMYDEATQVLDGMLEEDDEVVDTWYLLGFLNRLRATASEDADAAFNENARFYLHKAKKVFAKNPNGDEEMMKHVDELLSEVGPGDEMTNEEEEDWEDVDSSDDEDDGNEME